MDGYKVDPVTGDLIGHYQAQYIQPSWTMVYEPLPDPNYFYLTRWNFSTLVWEEGGDVEAINAQRRSDFLDELTDKVTYLTKRSVISSVAKEEKDIEYLEGQVLRYKHKYNVAKHFVDNSGAIFNQIWHDQIVSEMNTTIIETGAPLTIPVFMGLIVQYYEAGQEREQKFNAAIESFRCKTKDLILTNQFERARTCLDLSNTVTDAVSMELLDSLLIQLDLI